jgi:hypothetical protein
MKTMEAAAEERAEGRGERGEKGRAGGREVGVAATAAVPPHTSRGPHKGAHHQRHAPEGCSSYQAEHGCNDQRAHAVAQHTDALEKGAAQAERERESEREGKVAWTERGQKAG